MPTAVPDRLDTAHDLVYFLVRRPRYFFDLNAIREPLEGPARVAAVADPASSAPPPKVLVGRNPGDVWQIRSANYRGAHFATFPAKLVERPLLATCPERICAHCGTPWRRSLKTRTTAPQPNQIGTGQWRVRRYPTRLARALDIDIEELYALAGYTVSDKLPEFGTYLRAKYDLPDQAVDQLDEYFQMLRDKYESTPSTEAGSGE